jgi:hypothetical protein
MHPHGVAIVLLTSPIALFLLSTPPALGQPAPEQPKDLTPRQVADAFQAVQNFGCTHAGYASADSADNQGSDAAPAASASGPDGRNNDQTVMIRHL